MSNQPVTEPQKFARDIFWLSASSLSVPLFGLITLPALTKHYSAEIYAVWIQSVFVVWLLSFVLNLSLGNAVVRFLSAEDDNVVKRRALGAMLWPTFVFSLLIIIISLFLSQEFSEILFAGSDYTRFIPLIFSWAGLEALFSLLLAYLLARRMIKRMSIIQVSITLFKMAVIVILSLAGYGLGSVMGCIVAGETIFVIIIFLMIVNEIGWPWPTMRGLKGYLAFSIPLLPGGILYWALSVSDRYFIANLVNLNQSGIYSASFSVGSLISLFYSPIQVALFPVLSRLWEQNEQLKVRNYLEYSNKLFVTLAIPAAAGIYIVSQPLLGLLATPEYAAGRGLVLLIAVSVILSGLYQLNVFVILLAQKTKWLLPITATAVAAYISINLVMIPILGITGAAIAALVAYLILAVIVCVWSRTVIKYSIGLLFMIKVIAGALLMAWCISFFQMDGILGILIAAVAGVSIFSLLMWLLRAFSAGDIKLIKEIILGLRQGVLLR